MILRDGEVAFEHSYGYRDFPLQLPADRNTVYLLGSLTKPLTAACIMQLVAEGSLDLEEELSAYFPEYEKVQNVRVSHLLCHMSGIADYWNRVGISSIDYTDPYAIFDFIMTHDLQRAPGSQFQYANSNYIILGILIEKITGQPYAERLKTTVLSPLRMQRTGIIPDNNGFSNVAVGYMRTIPDAKEAAKPEQTIIFGNAYSAGGLYSTAADLVRLDAALNENTLFPESIKKEMWLPRSNAYGYGWYVGDQKVWHGGDICGFSTRLTKYLDSGITVIILNNVDGKKEHHIGHYADIIEEAIRRSL